MTPEEIREKVNELSTRRCRVNVPLEELRELEREAEPLLEHVEEYSDLYYEVVTVILKISKSIRRACYRREQTS